MCLLPEGPGADLADEGLLPRVDLEMLLKVEPLGVDEEAAHRTTLVVRPDRKGCCHMIAYSKRSCVSRLMNKNQRCGSGTYSWIRIRNKSFWICNTDKKKPKWSVIVLVLANLFSAQAGLSYQLTSGRSCEC